MKKIILFALALSLGFVSFSQEKTKEVSAAKFYILLKGRIDCVLLDASPVKMYKKEHIKGAKSIAESSMIKTALKSVDKESPILVYCKYGHRSKVASKKIVEMGFKEVYHLYDGLYEWNDKEYPIVSKKKKKK